MQVNTIVTGDCLKVMEEWPDKFINCCISSPLYWALRDYGLPPSIWDGDKNCEHKWEEKISSGMSGGPSEKQESNKGGWREPSKYAFCSNCGAWRGTLGLEPTFELYIKHLCDIYDEVFRVLRPDGTCWVNLRDTYWGGKGQSGRCDHNIEQRIAEGRTFQRREYTLPTKHCPQDGKHDTVQAKSLCLIPQRFAIEMVNRGWILRNVIIWKKPNPMPSSAKDRFTVDFEYVYFFVKSKKYWFEPQYEPQSETSHPRYARGLTEPLPADPNSKELKRPGYDNWREKTPIHKLPLGRNKRCVWTIPTQPYPDAHFATFPEKLVEPMIKAGCPEFVCTKCGKAREKIYKPTNEYKKYLGKTFKGYTDCGCGKEFRAGIVLDCFCWLWHDFTGGCKAA